MTSAGESANSTLARLDISFIVDGWGLDVNHPVDRRPMQMIHCVGTLATSHATRTLHSTPETAQGMNRNMA
jgi:hypothetical protein